MSNDMRRGAIILSLFLVAVLTNGANMTEGIFYSPIREEFGFSRAFGATLASTTHLTTGAMLLFSGMLLRRIPAQIMQSGGFVFLALGYATISMGHGYATLFAGYFLVGLGQGLVALLVVSPVVVSNWFNERRNLALAAIYAGTSLGGAAMTAYLGTVVADHGWRAGYVMMTLPMLAMPILLLLFVRTAPPEGEAQATGTPPPSTQGLTVREGLALPRFWLLVTAFALYLIVSAAIFLHFVPSLIESGLSPAAAATRMSVLLLAAVPGKLLFGWIGDRIGIRRCLVGVLGLASVALLFYASGVNTASIVLFMVSFGLAYSAPLVLIPMALADMVGRRNLSVFAGIAMVVSNTGFGVGPVLGGWLRDQLGDYSRVFIVLAGGLFAAAVLITLALREDHSAGKLGLKHAA